MRRSCVSGGDRNTRRLACDPVGVAISVVSLGAALVNVSVPPLPPALRPMPPASAAPAARR
jgi:hypothetical protein